MKFKFIKNLSFIFIFFIIMLHNFTFTEIQDAKKMKKNITFLIFQHLKIFLD